MVREEARGRDRHEKEVEREKDMRKLGRKRERGEPEGKRQEERERGGKE